jgi:predicted transcriptional regulator
MQKTANGRATFGVTMKADLAARIDRLAEEERRTRSNLLEVLLEKALEIVERERRLVSES